MSFAAGRKAGGVLPAAPPPRGAAAGAVLAAGFRQFLAAQPDDFDLVLGEGRMIGIDCRIDEADGRPAAASEHALAGPCDEAACRAALRTAVEAVLAGPEIMVEVRSGGGRGSADL